MAPGLCGFTLTVPVACKTLGMDASQLLSLVAIAISAIALAWSVISSLLRLPRVGVVLGKSVHIRVAEVEIETSYVVSVINGGSEAITITDVGLSQPRGAIVFSVDRIRADGNEEIKGDSLPVRVEAHGSCTWVIPEKLIRVAPSLPMYAYALRYRNRLRKKSSPHSMKISPDSEYIL